MGSKIPTFSFNQPDQGADKSRIFSQLDMWDHIVKKATVRISASRNLITELHETDKSKVPYALNAKEPDEDIQLGFFGKSTTKNGNKSPSFSSCG